MHFSLKVQNCVSLVGLKGRFCYEDDVQAPWNLSRMISHVQIDIFKTKS